jgi:hypothetical protein
VTLAVIETLRTRWNANPDRTFGAFASGFAAGLQEAIRTLENDPELKELAAIHDARLVHDCGTGDIFLKNGVRTCSVCGATYP